MTNLCGQRLRSYSFMLLAACQLLCCGVNEVPAVDDVYADYPDAISFDVGTMGNDFTLGPDNSADPALFGLSGSFPPGSIPELTTIRIKHVPDIAMVGERVGGPAIRVLPTGLKLQSVGRLFLPYDPKLIHAGDMAFAAVRPFGGTRRLIAGLTSSKGFAIDFAGAADYQVLLFSTGLLPPTSNPGVDVLFVIDNSPSMLNKQDTIVGKVKGLFEQITTACSNLHVGVVTTNMGTVPKGMGTWGSPAVACDSEIGDGGIFQTQTCLATGVTGCKCAAASKTVIDPAFSDRFIRYYVDPVSGLTTSNLITKPDGMPLGAQEAFSCLAQLGEKGCGIEQQLLAAQAALENSDLGKPNQYFLRDPLTSKLVIIFLTDEDDGSVDPSERSKLDQFDVSDCSKNMKNDYSCYSWSFRGYALSTQCDMDPYALNTRGKKMNCIEDNSRSFLTKVDDFVSAYTTGGREVIIGGIWPDAAVPVELTPFSDAMGSTASYAYGLKPSSAGCDSGLDSSPQHRLAKLAASSNPYLTTYQGNVCHNKDYDAVLTQIKNKITTTYCK